MSETKYTTKEIVTDSDFAYMSIVKEMARDRYSMFNMIHRSKKPEDEKENWYKYRAIELCAPVFLCKHQLQFNPWTKRNEGLEDVNAEHYAYYNDEDGEYLLCHKCDKIMEEKNKN